MVGFKYTRLLLGFCLSQLKRKTFVFFFIISYLLLDWVIFTIPFYLHNWLISHTIYIFLQAALGFVIYILTLSQSPSNTIIPLWVACTNLITVNFYFFSPIPCANVTHFTLHVIHPQYIFAIFALESQISFKEI